MMSQPVIFQVNPPTSAILTLVSLWVTLFSNVLSEFIRNGVH